jgi:hypothetical protein
MNSTTEALVQYMIDSIENSLGQCIQLQELNPMFQVHNMALLENSIRACLIYAKEIKYNSV